jgi:hypothetical protein
MKEPETQRKRDIGMGPRPIPHSPTSLQQRKALPQRVEK